MFNRIHVLSIALLAATACGSQSGSEPAGPDKITLPGDTNGDPNDTGGVTPGPTPNPNTANPNTLNPNTPEPTGTPGVAYMGRWDLADPNNAVSVWPAASVTAKFTGSQVAVTIYDPEVYHYWINNVNVVINNYVNVYIDGGSKPLVIGPLTGSPKTYNVVPSDAFATLSNGTHTITLAKRNDARVGPLAFKGFTFPGGGKLLAPPAAKARRIEFIGASGAAGYGNLGDGMKTSCHFEPVTEDGTLAYPTVTANLLQADYANVSFTGKGVLRNIWPTTDATNTMPVIYPFTNPPRSSVRWDFSTWTPQVVVMDIGSNDFDLAEPGEPQIDDARPDLVSGFLDTYEAFVKTVHAKYPQAHIVITKQSDFSPAQGVYLSQVVQRFNGATWLSSYDLPSVDYKTLGLGCDAHPSVGGHAFLAQKLAAHLQGIMGW